MEFVVWIAIGLVAAAVALWFLHRREREFRPTFAEVALAVIGGVAAGVAFATVERSAGGRVVMIAAISVVLSGLLAITESERRHR